LTILGHVTFKWQQGSVVVELDWPHSKPIPQNLPLDAKISEISFTESKLKLFCLEFHCHGNKGMLSKILLAEFDGPTPKNPHRCKVLDGPIPKPPCRCKDLAEISSRSRVIAHFVPNFVAMATRESPGKSEWQLDWPSLKTTP